MYRTLASSALALIAVTGLHASSLSTLSRAAASAPAAATVAGRADLSATTVRAGDVATAAATSVGAAAGSPALRIATPTPLHPAPVTAAAVEVAAAPVAAAPASTPPTPAGPVAPWFGVLQADGQHAAQERAAHLSVVELELNWSSYEPAPGSFDSAYAATMRSRLAAMRAAGMQVILDAGLQYPPAWVFGLDAGTRFVDQYGDVWHGGVSEDVANAVYDPAVRAVEAAYIARLAADLGGSFYAIRAGGLLQDELRYPPQTVAGHGNAYWAFDANAQAGSPVPGWRPGQPGTDKAAAFLQHYLQSIAGFETWLTSTYRSHFSGYLQVLMPSWGLRPGDEDAAVARLLDGSTPAAGWGTLAMGLDWPREIAALPDSHVLLSGTWMERGDDGTTPTTLGPTHYLATLAAARGLRVTGENADPGDSAATLRTIVDRARAWGLAGLMWLDEPALVAGGGGGFPTYGALVAGGAHS